MCGRRLWGHPWAKALLTAAKTQCGDVLLPATVSTAEWMR